MKPRLYNRLEQQEENRPKRKYNPVGLNIALTEIDDSITAWRKVLQSHIAKGTKDEQCLAQTVIKTLEDLKQDILIKASKKNGKIPRTT